jgi:hypothetical protein
MTTDAQEATLDGYGADVIRRCGERPAAAPATAGACPRINLKDTLD